MPGPWVTIADLTSRVADHLSQAADALPVKWQSIVADALSAATSEIAGAMLARGFSPAQVDQWDRRREYSLHIGKFWALTAGGGLANYSDTFIAKLDRRKELATVPFTIGGKLVQPGPETVVATPVVGRLNESGYRFDMTDDF